MNVVFKGILASLLLFIMSAHASITTKIAKIYPPDEFNPNYEILAYYDGRVFEVSPDNLEVLETLKTARMFDSSVDIETGSNYLIMDKDAPEMITAANLNSSSTPESFLESSTYESFEPSEVEDMDKATEMFNHLYKRTRNKTECFNRAHIWNRQLDKSFGVKSEKIFIFYTRKYRRAYRRWKWWFHTAPLIRVDGNPIVMDREFTTNPVTAESWEWQFSAPNREDETHRCNQIDEMSEYYDRYNANNNYCNTLIAPMYYWEPSELKKRESQNRYKTEWVNWEIRLAARDVYGRWRDVYEELMVD